MRTRAPLLLRLSERPGLSPWRVALAVAAGLAAVFMGAEWALGRLPLLATNAHVPADFQVALGLIAIVAYMAGAFPTAVRGAERTLRELAPAFLRPAEAAEAAAAVSGRAESADLLRTGAFGVLGALAIPLATNLELATWALWELPPEAVAHRILLVPLGWTVPRFTRVVWLESRRLARLGADTLRVDLLDLRPLEPLARAGIRHALLFAGALSLLVVGFRDTTGIAPGLWVVLALAMLTNLVLCGLVLALALRGGRAAIAREKERAAAAADVAIRALRAPGAQHSAGALADALAWKRFVADAPDWPIDFPALRRFVLPLALPLLSLFASAYLDRVLTRLPPA
jgi:hypothetical protein